MIQSGKFTYDTAYWSAISSSMNIKYVFIQFNFGFCWILAAKNLIDHLLVVDREKRMHADEILLHSWILTVGQSKLIRNTEELKATLRLEYDIKIKEYAMENTAA